MGQTRRSEESYWIYLIVAMFLVGMIMGSMLVKSEVSKPIPPKVVYTGDIVCS